MAKSNYKELLKFGGIIDNKTNMIFTIFGAFVLLLIWHFVTLNGTLISPKILPSPISVFQNFGNLFTEHNLPKEAWYSVKINLWGYFFAIIFALPLGFLIGIFPLPKSMFQKYTDAMRYLPPPAITGIFMTAFGLGIGMKASFLAFAIFMSLLPAVIQKIEDLQNPKNDKDFVYLQTIKTLGANNYQKFTKVYFPYVMGRVFSDIIILTAISYTYIIIIELLNHKGGLGGLLHLLRRQGLMAEYYGVLFSIISIGLFQNFLLVEIDKFLFPYKYEKMSIVRRLFTTIKKFPALIKKWISGSKLKTLFLTDKK